MNVVALLRWFFQAAARWFEHRRETKAERDVIKRAREIAKAHGEADEFDEAIANNDIGAVESMLRELRRRPRYPKPGNPS